MKIILTGATGFVGAEVLSRLIATPAVTAITCLSRRDLGMQSEKVTTILHSDFAAYDQTLVEQLAGHDACIWALGGKASDLGTPNVFARITHTFTLALAERMATQVSAPFTFCYLSGMGADPSETARLPWERLTRHLKGRTEKDLSLLQKCYSLFCAHSFRPGGILPRGASRLLRWGLAPIVIGVGELADAMIVAAISPDLFHREPTISNAAIKQLAQRYPGLAIAPS